jgi:hypothetical protein
VAGAVGISGGTVEEDIQVADCVAGALEQMERWSGHVKGILPAKVLDGDLADLLESRLREALEQMNCDLPPGAASILSGAIAIAAAES